jgi:hypothetical protein
MIFFQRFFYNKGNRETFGILKNIQFSDMESSKLNNYSTDMYDGSSCTLHGKSRQRQQIKIKKANTPK